ncbi:MAG: addiction module protein [Acidobacteriota bacterium]
MTRAEIEQVVLELPRGERIALMHAIWKSLVDEQSSEEVSVEERPTEEQSGPVSQEELALIDERSADFDSDPETVVSWEEMKAGFRLRH